MSVYVCVVGSVREEDGSEQVDGGYSLGYEKRRNDRMGKGSLGLNKPLTSEVIHMFVVREMYAKEEMEVRKARCGSEKVYDRGKERT